MAFRLSYISLLGIEVNTHMAANSHIEITFKAEELYFSAAEQAFQQATALRNEVLTKEQDYSLAELFHLAVAYNWGDEIDPDRDLIAIADDLLEALDLFTLAATSVDVFTVMTLEAHINAIADSRFSKTTQNHFDRLSLEGKWLLAPQLFGLGQVFDKGKEPFQSFKAVIQRRNGVVHTKGEGRVVILSNKATPDDYMDLKLTQAESALYAARSMAEELAKALNIAAPAWGKGELPEHYVAGATL